MVELSLELSDLLHKSDGNQILVVSSHSRAVDLESCLICFKLSRVDVRKIKSQSPTDHFTKLAVISIDLSAANHRAGKTSVGTYGIGVAVGAGLTVLVTAVDVVPTVSRKIVKCLNDKLRLGLRSIVELCILILACKLLCGRKTCYVSVEHAKHIVHHITKCEGEAVAGNVHTVGGIHKTYKHDLNVGVELNDSVDNTLVVDKEACYGISKDTESCLKALGAEALNNAEVRRHLCLELIVNCKNDLLCLLRLKECERIFKIKLIVAVGKVAAHHYRGNSAEKVRTEGSVTDAKSDDISVLNSRLIEAGKLCNSLGRTVARIIPLTVFAGVGVVKHLLKPAVGRHLASAKEEKKVLCAECRRSKLGVFYVIAKSLKVLLKLECIRAFAVYVITLIEVILTRILAVTIKVVLVTLVVAVESVSVSHRVTDGNVVDILVLVRSTCRECGSGNAEEHCTCHDQSKNLRTYFFHFHIFPFLTRFVSIKIFFYCRITNQEWVIS